MMKIVVQKNNTYIVGIACALLRQTSNIYTVHNYPSPAEGYCFCMVRTSVLPSVRHFCVQSHILEVLWQISLKLGMSIYMDKRMMQAKWHCTPSVNNRVIALYIYIFCANGAYRGIRHVCDKALVWRGISIQQIFLFIL